MKAYNVVRRPSPGDPDEPLSDKYYASGLSFGVISEETVARNVAVRSGHSPGQLIGLFQDYLRRAEQHILNGKTVSMSPIGTIIPVLKGIGSDTYEGWDTSFLNKFKLNFRACPKTRKRLQIRDAGGEMELKKWGVKDFRED